MTNTKTYAVHYGHGHMLKWAVMPNDYHSLATARKAASSKRLASYTYVIIVDTDGNEWQVR